MKAIGNFRENLLVHTKMQNVHFPLEICVTDILTDAHIDSRQFIVALFVIIPNWSPNIKVPPVEE